MKIIEVLFTPWGKKYWFESGKHDLKVGEHIVVKTSIGIEMGKIVGLKEVKIDDKEKIKPILRKATLSDFDKIKEKQLHKKDDMEVCSKFVEKYALPIKVVDLCYAFDGGRLTFCFTANGRVDFRELVKDLTHHFQKSIRLRQIGVRDEAKCYGDVGPCGEELCCKSFLKNLGQVSSDFIETQQILHRGTNRLSGMCGRLKCCLKYEQQTYEELSKNMPRIGSSIKTPEGKGRVISWNILKQTVDVQLEKDKNLILETEICN